MPLKVIAAEVDQLDVGSSASASFTSTGVSVRTGAAFTGTLSVIYRIQDATKDPARETQGRVTVIVRDRPEQPNAPTVTAGDAFADVRWQAPAPNNSPITGYEVSYNGQVADLRRGRRRHHPAHHRTRQRHRVHLRRARDQRHRRLGVVGGHDRDALRHADGPAERAAHARPATRRPTSPLDWSAPDVHGRRLGATTSGASTTRRAGQTTAGTSASCRQRRRGHVHARGARDQRRRRPAPARSRPTPSACSNPPPPPPRGYICKGSIRRPCRAAAYAGASYVTTNFPAAATACTTSHQRRLERLLPRRRSASAANGTQTLQNWLGIRNDDRAICGS